MAETMNNKQVVLKCFITGVPKEADMELRVGTARVRVPAGSCGVLVKNGEDEGVLGVLHPSFPAGIGFTAYAGFYEVCSPERGDYVFVSAASGAVGQLVGQLAKVHCCYVVGSAGTSQKVFSLGIDIYFDNVGGSMIDAALLNMRAHGRIAVCGMVSQHGISGTEGIHNLFCLITKRIRMQGFLQSDYVQLFPQFLNSMVEQYKQGKIIYIEDTSEGLESAPGAFVGL